MCFSVSLDELAYNIRQAELHLGANSHISSSVACPRKKNLVTIFSQQHLLGL